MKRYYLNAGSPVNWTAPLNRGLTHWWIPMPDFAGGSRLFDICNPGPLGTHGTLSGTTRPSFTMYGGLPFCDYDGTSSHASLNYEVGKPYINELTASIWFIPHTVSGQSALFAVVLAVNGLQRDLVCDYGLTSTKMRIAWQGAIAFTGTTTLIPGRLYHAVFIRRGRQGAWTGEVWLSSPDGPVLFLDASGTSSNTLTANAGSVMSIGRANANTPGSHVDGFIGSIRIWRDIAFNFGQVRAEFYAGLGGYRSELSWLRGRAFSPAVTANGAWWHQHILRRPAA